MTEAKQNRAINEKLAHWLFDNKNTKQQLSEMLGCSWATLENRISGETTWRWDEVCKLADLFNCPLEELRDR